MKEYLGLGLIILSILVLITPNLLFIFDTNKYTYVILDSPTNNTSISFNFPKSYIPKFYEISNGEKVYTTYLNVYINDFLDNSTVNSLNIVGINSNYYQPVNVSYEYSFQIEDETLNDLVQAVSFNKTGSYTIDRIDISYYGVNAYNYDIYSNMIPMIVIVFMLIGVVLIIV